MLGTISRRIPYNTKTQIFYMLFLKLRYVLVIAMLFNLFRQKNGGHRARFQPTFPPQRAGLTSVASQAAWKKAAILVVRALIRIARVHHT